jgi:hypothetical protein
MALNVEALAHAIHGRAVFERHADAAVVIDEAHAGVER